MKRSKRRLAILMALILALFFGLILYMVYFEFVEAPGLRADARNMRNWVDETQFGRGRFYDRHQHEIVGRERQEDGTYVRYVNHPNMYSHLIGYNSKMYGKTGLESALNARLLNLPGDNPIAALRGQVLNEGVGNDAVLTIDNDLQYEAYTALEGHKGAAVILNPKTGEVLAMVSLPSFNLNTMEDDWSSLVEDDEGRLFPRATQGLYAPGSVMKPITALALLEAGVDLNYEDTGQTTVEGKTYQNYNGNAYGSIGLMEALMHSSNVYFIDKTKDLSADALGDAAASFGFNQPLPFEVKTAQSVAPYEEGMDTNQKVSNAFGQGDVLVTPLQMAVAYGALANGGKVMRPYVVSHWLSPKGATLAPTGTQVLESIDSAHVRTIDKALQATADENGLSERVGEAVAGKTGTAQTSGDSTNAWTIAYAPADKPRVLVALVLEDDGRTGGEAALPLVADLLRTALQETEE
ncbi:MAG: penicillin-binding transpeptidase domain-containing protein [Peptoniphilaceae bacterium]|nr:penicillin-binding transpeptidase domain-containing protein [Peptoniphilaceae bacterium]MDY6085967.1 penicillin-binding transpeptidase domain-containing protein [Peptoniphilaceae bacterium]